MQINSINIINTQSKTNSYRNNFSFGGYTYKVNEKFCINPVKYYLHQIFSRTLKAAAFRIKKPSGILANITQEIQSKNSYMWDINPGNRKKYLIAMHGMGQNISNVQNLYEAIIKRTNYAVLAPEYRGFGKNPRCNISEESIYKDALNGLNYLKSKGIKESDITVSGHSFGGFAASKLAQNNPNLHRLILIGSIDSLAPEKVNIEKIIKNKLPKIIKFVFKKSPILRRPLRTIYQTQNLISETKIPISIIHALDDPIIHISSAKKLQSLHPNVTSLHILPKGGHRLDDTKIDKIISILNNRNNIDLIA